MIITPRPYQEEALEALDLHIRTKETNPCVVIPTGGGKSILMAWAIQQWKRDYSAFRCCVLAHRKELVKQNSEEMHELWPGGDIGVYSAGLGRRDFEHSVMFMSIDSVAKKWGEFPPFNLILIDEAHRIPATGEGKYLGFINGCRKINPDIRAVGFTATPFRMNSPLCHRDHILNEICYEAYTGDLIAQGFLCKLRSKVGDVQPDLSKVKKNSGGDYITTSLAGVMDRADVVGKAIRSAMGHIQREGRKSVVFFCVDVEHCRRVSYELRKYGVEAPCVTAETPGHERDRIARQFKDGQIRAICNVNVYTEGFNAKRVDCIVLLRPTLSKGLFVQMVGRGFRLHESKSDCLVLDYAHCIDEHGPVDCIEAGRVTLEECKVCGDTFSRIVRKCPNCGWEIPKEIIEKAEAEERERRLHEEEASKASILGNQPETIEVDDVTVHRHRKPGSPDSLRVQYRCGLSTFREWICLGHGKFPEQKARRWWWERFGDESKTITVDQALEDMLLGHRIKEITATITVVRRGKHTEIVRHGLLKQQRRTA